MNRRVTRIGGTGIRVEVCGIIRRRLIVRPMIGRWLGLGRRLVRSMDFELGKGIPGLRLRERRRRGERIRSLGNGRVGRGILVVRGGVIGRGRRGRRVTVGGEGRGRGVRRRGVVKRFDRILVRGRIRILGLRVVLLLVVGDGGVIGVVHCVEGRERKPPAIN